MSGAVSGSTIADRRFNEISVHELHDILRLRCDVFVVEQACVYPDLDGRDTEPETRHIWMSADDGSVIAYVRCLQDAPGQWRIGRVVTAVEHRGSGHAATLVNHAVDSLQGEIVLDAQSYLLDWYNKLGFVQTGDEFLEDGIPHIPMRYQPDDKETP